MKNSFQGLVLKFGTYSLQKQLMQMLVEEDTYVDTTALVKILCSY